MLPEKTTDPVPKSVRRLRRWLSIERERKIRLAFLERVRAAAIANNAAAVTAQNRDRA